MTGRKIKELEQSIRDDCPARIIYDDSLLWTGAYFRAGNVIKIRSSLTGASLLRVLKHEAQHAICYKANCKCFRDNTQEYHAMLAELKMIVVVDDEEMTKAFREHMTKLAQREAIDRYGHTLAARRIIKHKSFALI